LEQAGKRNYTSCMHDRAYARQALGHVLLAPYHPLWPAYFLRERERLSAFLGEMAERMEHYGSTAVAGMSAKPVIDMMAPVSSLDAADAYVDRLAETGYLKIDAGFFKRRFFRREEDDAGLAYHLHLVVAPTWPIKNELLLRDWLRTHPDEARAYETLKTRLAAEFADDMPRYTEAKTAFLRRTVNRARAERGLPPEEDWNE